MSMDIQRVIGLSTGIAVSNTVGAATLIPLGPASGGVLHVVSTSTDGAILVEFQVRHSPGSAEFRLADSSNDIITLSIQPGRCYAIPDELFGAMQFLVIAQTPGETAVLAVTIKG